ncbi:MAG TPA: bacillithiol biosynthesis cysteine-adding enzyme BshC [Longimicrobiaceae bacterium]
MQPVSGPALVTDYLNGVPSALEFYGSDPRELESYRRRAESVTRRFDAAARARAAEALTPTSPTARQRLERFVEEGGVMVTTGQQAGLLTGPLFTIYKALTAARLAQELERRLGMLVLPVFWTASEDHDWEEVNHAYLSIVRDGIRRVQLTRAPSVPTPMSHVLIDDDARIILEESSDFLVGNTDNEYLLNWIREAYRPEKSVAGAFTELLGRLLAPFDFCMTDAAHPAVKRGSAGLLAEALERSREHERLLAERTRAIESAGYRGQVAVLEGATNVFRYGPAGRERIYRDGDGYRVGEGTEPMTPAALHQELEADPGRFSPNVFLRPVVESAVFPTISYVGGPGEINYFAQIAGLFPAFGMEPPVVAPRASLLLVEMPMRRLLEKLELEPEQLARPRHELVELLAQDSVPDTVRSTLTELGRSLTEGYRILIEESKRIDPTLEGALARLRNEALTRVSESEKKITQHIKRKEGVRIGQLDRLLAHLRPDGKPQDRVLNVIPFLGRHGLSLLTRIYEEIRVDLR